MYKKTIHLPKGYALTLTAASAAVSTLFSDTSDELILGPGGTLLITNPGATGYAVTATTADLLRIENADIGAAATYDIIIAGDSA